MRGGGAYHHGVDTVQCAMINTGCPGVIVYTGTLYFICDHSQCLPGLTCFRLENLMLVPSSVAARWCGHVSHVSTDRKEKDHVTSNSDMSLYHLAMQQLPFDPHDEYVESLTLRYYNEDGELVEDEDDCHTYYECRYAPCIMMERGLREFSICGRCQVARYCGPVCQQKDWAYHKKICREKRRPFPLFLRDTGLDR